MNTIHAIIQKVFVLGVAFCFMFVAIYVPHGWNKVDKVEAGFATTAMQAVQLVEEAFTAVQSYLTTAATVAIEWFQSSLYFKEFISDGLGWWVAKMILSQVTRSIVQWINSGFQGSPSFVQDLEGFALRMADQAAGLYLANLGSPLLTQFVCAPFRLNLQIAISSSYRYNRSGMPYGASRCTLTQAMQNVDRFTDGSFIHGGWNAFYQVSSQPLTYTPYGEYLAAQNEMALRANVSIRNENQFLNFGNGFFSSKVCDMVATAAVPRERCMVSTPGQVISENLNFHLTAGSRSLIAADELNEILGALLGQLAQTAITGAHGLLGMSNSTGYTLPQGHIDTLVNEQSGIGQKVSSGYLVEVEKQLAIEQKYMTLITEAIPLLEQLNNTESLKERDRALVLQIEIQKNIDTLTRLRDQLLNPNTTADDLSQMISEYSSLVLHTDSQINRDSTEWLGMFEGIYKKAVMVIDQSAQAITTHRPQLVDRARFNDAYGQDAQEEVDLIDNVYKDMIERQKAELDLIGAEWNNSAIPKVNVLQHFIDLKNGNIPGVPPLYSEAQMNEVIERWQNIETQP